MEMTIKMENPNIDDFGTKVPDRDPSDIDIGPPEEIEEHSVDDLIDKVVFNKKETKSDTIITQWTLSGPETFISIPPSISKLKGGVYSVGIGSGKVFYRKKSIKIDDLIKFPDSQSDKIINEISSFWNKGKVFKEYGFLHRRGYLLYGPQGSGKTALVQQIMSEIVNDGGIVFMCDRPSHLEAALEEFRMIEPSRPVVCLFEDIDATIDKYGEDELLSLLDGESQIDKVLNLATTNYPEKLDKRIVSRPRRFDRIIKIGMPSDVVRRVYFSKKLNIKNNELDLWVKSTDNFSFAACAELVISVKCLDIPFDTAVNILKNLMTSKVSSNDFNEPLGFGFGSR